MRAARRVVRFAPKLLLKLVMRAAALVADGSEASAPRPSDAPRAHAPGPNADRVLILGGGLAVGWGVRSHDLALPGALARAVAAHTGRGCTVDLRAQHAMSVSQACRIIADIALDRYDSILLVLGVNDALRLTGVSHWERRLRQMLTALAAATPTHTHIFVTTVQPVAPISHYGSLRGRLADRHASALNAVTERLCHSMSRARLIPFPAVTPDEDDTSRHRTPQQYTLWAAAMAAAMSGTLRVRPDRPLATPTPDGERARQRAVDRLDLPALEADPVLSSIVTRARRGLDSKTAILTVIDRDLQRNIAAAEPMPATAPREHSFCTFTIRGGDAMIVPDTRLDDRFRHNPAVTDGPKLRFYAGFPIEAPGGERIGSLCVLDTRPRSSRDGIDTVYLRELALQAERRLWSIANGQVA